MGRLEERGWLQRWATGRGQREVSRQRHRPPLPELMPLDAAKETGDWRGLGAAGLEGSGGGLQGRSGTAEMAGTRWIWPAIGLGGDWSSGTPWLLLSNREDRESRGG